MWDVLVGSPITSLISLCMCRQLQSRLVRGKMGGMNRVVRFYVRAHRVD
jgi:hypothetical protein